MKGWLVVNSFVEAEKFTELYTFLRKAANAQGIQLEIRTTDEFTYPIGEEEREERPDFVLFWDKDIYLAQRMEAAGLWLFNSARAIELCDNKVLTALALKGKVETPRTIPAPKTFEGLGYCKKDFLKKAVERLGLPMVIKEAYGSFGQQVYLAQTLEEAEAIVDRIGHKDFLMQEFIADSRGRDVRVNVVGGRVVCAMLRYNDHDFRSNITNGGSMMRVELTAEQEAAAVAACAALGLDFAGVDILFGQKGRPIVCEVNSNPHFKSSLACTGVDMSEKIMEYIRGCME